MKRPDQGQVKHWTETSLEGYKSRITFDFITQLVDYMEGGPISQSDLALRLGVGESAVSQFLNNPNNLTLKTIIKYTRALGLKVSLLAYNDGDSGNTRGPIGSEVFAACWENAGRPFDLLDIEGRPVANSPQYWTDSTITSVRQGHIERLSNVWTPVVQETAAQIETQELRAA